VGALYRPPNNTDQEYLNSLRNALASIPPNSHIWLAGDFNLGDINWETASTKPGSQSNRLCDQLIDISQDHGLTQIVDKPTRTTESTESTLYLFFTNFPDMVNRHEIIPGISDHDIPILDISTRIQINKKPPRKVFMYKKANMEGLLNQLSTYSQDFCNRYGQTDPTDTEEMWTDFKNAILKSIDEFIPSKMISNNKHSLPWINTTIKQAIRKRNNLHAKSRKSKKNRDWTDYKEQKSKVQALIRTSYWKHIEDNIFGDDNEDHWGSTQKRFWTHVKSIKKDRTGTAPLKEHGLLVSGAKDKAEILNRQYQSVFSIEDPENIPEPEEPPQPKMSDIKVTEEGILHLLSGLKENKACGPDLLSPRILKAAAKPLSRCLHIIFNASLKLGSLPKDWRSANIIPIFKKGERFKAANYQPVSLTCICTKMLEHIVVSNLMDHFDTHNILTDCQHGFRARRSCETQLISLTQELHEYLEAKEQVDMIVLDFSKAFDKVPHRRLMRKLWNYGIRGTTHAWIQAFLVDRSQRVMVDGEHSEWAKVESGVPQGTVLGPVLFLAFINDLPKAVPNARVRLFADDCVMYKSVSTEADCKSLQDDIHLLEQWEDKWCMSFNASKCNVITITRKRKKLHHPYILHNQPLEYTNSATYLGIELSSDLTWKKQIDKTCAKANKQLAFLRRNLQINNTKVKETAYKGLVRPVVEYCASVWDPYQAKYIKQVEMVQRRAARYVTRRYHNTSSVTDMINTLKWESLEQRRAKARLALFYKIISSAIAIPMPSCILLPNRPRPGFPHQFQMIFASTESFKNSYFPRTVRQWNTLPPSLATLDTFTQFKSALSSHTI
jgi:hypothetical protein